ncbi:MAG TPA: hypothetical protein VMM84_18985 [Pyrinomonadaceae bacterium]|nr:hypothetical protein [Pyrinomonadaceae bacterium]
MISKTRSRKSIAVCLAVAVFSVYSMVVLATPGAKASSGELSVSGQVTVNGQKAISGGTVFSDSVLVSAENSSAIVSISKVGRVELAPNSSLRLSFTDNSVSAMLDGSAHVSTLAGVTVNLTTKDGSIVADGSEPTSFTVNTARGNTALTTDTGVAELRAGGTVKQVAAGESATAGMPNPQVDDDGGISGGALAALLLAVGGAVAAIIYATTRNNDLNFGGSVTVVSPTK